MPSPNELASILRCWLGAHGPLLTLSLWQRAVVLLTYNTDPTGTKCRWLVTRTRTAAFVAQSERDKLEISFQVSDNIISLGQPQNGFIAKDGKVLKASLVGVDTMRHSIIVLYEQDNQMQVADDFCFYTARFAAEFAAAEH